MAVKVIESSEDLSEILAKYKSIDKFDYYTWKRILNQFYYGLPKYKLSDITDIEFLSKCRDYLAREVRRNYHNLNDYDRHIYDDCAKWLEVIRQYIKDARKKNSGTYDIEQSMSDDIWSIVHSCTDRNSCITPTGMERLEDLKVKYKNNIKLLKRVMHRILDAERFYD